jgi:acetyl esterase/lipase
MQASSVRLAALLLATAVSSLAGQDSSATGDSVVFRSGDVELRGVLYLPEGEPPYPAVFFLHGGGRRWLNAEPADFAHMVVERGMAALVYDKRGTGSSGGDWAQADFENLIADGGAAIRYLAGLNDIDADRIGVVGFSQGGRLAPVVAARYRLAAAISVSGPAVSPAETRLYALENSMRENGLSQEAIERSLALWRAFFEALESGQPLAPLDSAVPSITNQCRTSTRSISIPRPIGVGWTFRFSPCSASWTSSFRSSPAWRRSPQCSPRIARTW